MTKRKLPNLVSFLILTLITSVMWVTFDVYRLYNKTPDVVVPENISQELNPVLDQNTINQINSRVFFDDSQIPDQVATPQRTTSTLPQSLALPTAAPIASQSATSTQ